jgi:hypothetical protein
MSKTNLTDYSEPWLNLSYQHANLLLEFGVVLQSLILLLLLFHQTRLCEEWIRFSYSNEDTKDEERRQTTKCGAKRQVRTLSQDRHNTDPNCPICTRWTETAPFLFASALK